MSEIVFNLKNRIDKTSILLKELADIYFGLKTGDDSRFIHSSSLSANHKKLLRGENIHRYSYTFAGEYVDYLPNKMREHRSTARPGEPARFEQPKILVRDTGSGLECTLDLENYYVKDVLVINNPKSGKYSLSYIAGLLNSSLMRFYYNTSFPTLHVQQSELSVLPIHTIDTSNLVEKSLNDEIVAHVEQILALHTERQALDPGAYFDEIRSLDKRIQRLEAEIDRLVYQLYGLTEEEIRIVEGG